MLQHTLISFDISVWEIFAPLAAGARLVLARPGADRDTAYLARLLRERQVSVIGLVPSLLDVLLDEQPGLTACPALRYVFSGGEPLTTSVCQRLFAQTGAELHNFYGPTEATVDVTCWQCTPANLGEGVPIGRPLPNVSVHVLDEYQQPVPVSVTGELYVGGVGVARGYRNRPELTAQSFLDDPFSDHSDTRLYRTGDLTRWRPDGALEFIGRVDDQVKIRGHRIELGEVETALLGHPAVRQAVARPGGASHQRLDAFVVPESGAELNETVLRTDLMSAVPAYLVPDRIVVMPHLPLLPNGKIDRSALPENNAGTATIKTDGSTLAERLATLAAHVLDVPSIGPDDDFFAIGGTSLQATRFVARARRDLGVDIDLAAFIQAGTPRQLADQLTGRAEQQ